MLKNIFYAVLFIALVVGLSYLMSTYMPIRQAASDPSYIDEIAQLKARLGEFTGIADELATLKDQVTELSIIAQQVTALSDQLESLELKDTSENEPIEVAREQKSYLVGKALIQALNCKYVAHNHSSTRLITELTLLEDTIKELDADQDALLREVTLARTETAAQTPSAQDRLEIIWKLLLMADRLP